MGSKGQRGLTFHTVKGQLLNVTGASGIEGVTFICRFIRLGVGINKGVPN